MESANLHHHHQLQEHQLALCSSSSLSSSHNSSSYDVATIPHAWTQSITLNTDSSNFHPDCNGGVLNPRQKNESLVPTTSMIQDLGFHHWNLTNNAGTFNDQDLQLSKIKQELSADSFHRFTSISHNSTSSPSSIDDDHQKNLNDLREKLLLKTISSGFPINGEMYSNPHHGYVNSLGSLSLPSRGHFSQIYPSINISNLNQSSPPSSSSSFSSSNSFNRMNLQALDLLTSKTCLSPHDHNLGLLRDTALINLDRLNPTNLKPSSCSPSKVSSYTNQISEPKRSNGLVEPKAAPTPPPKKPRVDSRVTSPPFKLQVRKEKLGDRIAALQQLVAPFGKTDTASVLMEAIGYIKFLQNQVETLSVPYMKSSRNKSSRTMEVVSVSEDGKEEPKRDLRSRGLCLVPLSCMSYVTADSSGGGMWPPPPFSGGT